MFLLFTRVHLSSVSFLLCISSCMLVWWWWGVSFLGWPCLCAPCLFSWLKFGWYWLANCWGGGKMSEFASIIGGCSTVVDLWDRSAVWWSGFWFLGEKHCFLSILGLSAVLSMILGWDCKLFCEITFPCGLISVWHWIFLEVVDFREIFLDLYTPLKKWISLDWAAIFSFRYKISSFCFCSFIFCDLRLFSAVSSIPVKRCCEGISEKFWFIKSPVMSSIEVMLSTVSSISLLFISHFFL